MTSKVIQLVVPLANKPGTLAELCSVLGKATLNIIAISASQAKGRGRVGVITSI